MMLTSVGWIDIWEATVRARPGYYLRRKDP